MFEQLLGDAIHHVQYGTIVGGFADLAGGYKPGDVTFYVESEDINTDLRRGEKLGGEMLLPRTEIPGMDGTPSFLILPVIGSGSSWPDPLNSRARLAPCVRVRR